MVDVDEWQRLVRIAHRTRPDYLCPLCEEQPDEPTLADHLEEQH